MRSGGAERVTSFFRDSRGRARGRRQWPIALAARARDVGMLRKKLLLLRAQGGRAAVGEETGDVPAGALSLVGDPGMVGVAPFCLQALHARQPRKRRPERDA